MTFYSLSLSFILFAPVLLEFSIFSWQCDGHTRVASAFEDDRRDGFFRYGTQKQNKLRITCTATNNRNCLLISNDIMFSGVLYIHIYNCNNNNNKSGNQYSINNIVHVCDHQLYALCTNYARKDYNYYF